MACLFRYPLPAMVLTQADARRMLFQFEGKKWARVLGAMGMWLMASAAFLWWQNGFSVPVVGFAVFGVFAAAGAGGSATTVRGLEIDKDRGSVRYAGKTLAGNEIWERPFSQFASIGIHYPRAQHGQPRRGRTVSIEIVSRDGGDYRVAAGPAGAGKETAARELAARIGDMMGLPVVASIGKR